MVGLLVVTHGRLAEVLLDAARTIVGDVGSMEAVSFGWNDDVTEARERIRRAVERVDRGDGVVVLTDMFGGTPTNVALSLLDPGKIEVVTGVNLPMLIKYMNLRDGEEFRAAAGRIAEQGRRAIEVASDLLEKRADAQTGDAP